jgi:hypothetical protein
MPHRNLLSINLICPFTYARQRDQMSDDLMSEKVEVDPVGSGSSFRTPKHAAVERSCFVQVVNGKGQMKTWSLAHD